MRAMPSHPVHAPTIVTVYGTELCADCRRTRRYLDATATPYTWIDVGSDAEVRGMLDAAGYRAMPVVALADRPGPGRAHRGRARQRHRDRRVRPARHSSIANGHARRVPASARTATLRIDGRRPPSRFVEPNVDAIIGLAAFALTGLVATVAILWLVPLLIAAAIAASLGDA